MEVCRVYLSGAISDITLEDALKWRTSIINEVKYGDYEFEKKPVFFNPPVFYNTQENFHKTEKEVMEYELYQLRKSDVVIVNFNNPKSIGTAMELMLAKEYHIPVIAINKNKIDVHPWIKECITREVYSLKEAVQYFVEYYLW